MNLKQESAISMLKKPFKIRPHPQGMFTRELRIQRAGLSLNYALKCVECIECIECVDEMALFCSSSVFVCFCCDLTGFSILSSY
jgi:hypothetical protein